MTVAGKPPIILTAASLLLLAAVLLSLGCVKHYRYAPSPLSVPPVSPATVTASPAAPAPAIAAPAAVPPGGQSPAVVKPPATAKPAPVAKAPGEEPQPPAEQRRLTIDERREPPDRRAAPAAEQKPTPPEARTTQPMVPKQPTAAAPKQSAGGREQLQPLDKMGYSIQVGAFASLDNAVRLERLLSTRGVDAYHFRHESGLYKVRFGNHDSHAKARKEAERLQKQGVIAVFYIVRPEEYAAARVRAGDAGDLRTELVRTAHRFLGVPYRWGGTDDEDGFDCSGLTMVCYRLNGLNLPRESLYQFRAGRLIPKEELRPGDLVFFATRGGKRVSHVGIFIGNGKFIHAPRTGQDVRVDALADPFYTKTFIGGRSYF